MCCLHCCPLLDRSQPHWGSTHRDPTFLSVASPVPPLLLLFHAGCSGFSRCPRPARTCLLSGEAHSSPHGWPLTHYEIQLLVSGSLDLAFRRAAECLTGSTWVPVGQHLLRPARLPVSSADTTQTQHLILPPMYKDGSWMKGNGVDLWVRDFDRFETSGDSLSLCSFCILSGHRDDTIRMKSWCGYWSSPLQWQQPSPVGANTTEKCDSVLVSLWSISFQFGPIQMRGDCYYHGSNALTPST